MTMVMKGLPLTYSKDMQEDKEPVFDAADALALAVAAMTGMVSDMAPIEDNLRKRGRRSDSPLQPTLPTGVCGN